LLYDYDAAFEVLVLLLGVLLLVLGDALPSRSVLALEVLGLLLRVASAKRDEGYKGYYSHYDYYYVVAYLLEV
jgi:hypothetical protein